MDCSGCAEATRSHQSPRKGFNGGFPDVASLVLVLFDAGEVLRSPERPIGTPAGERSILEDDGDLGNGHIGALEVEQAARIEKRLAAISPDSDSQRIAAAAGYVEVGKGQARDHLGS